MTKQDVSQMVNTPETRRIVDVVKALPGIDGKESRALRKIVTEWWEMKFTFTTPSHSQPITMPVGTEE